MMIASLAMGWFQEIPLSADANGPTGIIALSGVDNYSDTEIYTVDPDGTNLQRLTDWVGHDSEASWSPDGSQLVVAHGVGEDRDLYLLGAGGLIIKRLTNDANVERTPSWFPDGTAIAFVSGSVSCCGSDVYKVDLASGASQPLTENAKAVSVSPDGKQIAVTRPVQVDGIPSNQLLIVDLASGDETPVSDPSDLNIFDLDWSPDGTRVAVGAIEPTTEIESGIYSVNIATHEAILLTSGPWYGAPAWSPDGMKLVYDCDFSVCVIDADGSNTRQVTLRGRSSVQTHPDWGSTPETSGPTPVSLPPTGGNPPDSSILPPLALMGAGLTMWGMFAFRHGLKARLNLT